MKKQFAKKELNMHRYIECARLSRFFLLGAHMSETKACLPWQILGSDSVYAAINRAAPTYSPERRSLGSPLHTQELFAQGCPNDPAQVTKCCTSIIPLPVVTLWRAQGSHGPG